jgi:hypothetical protein
VYTISTSVPSKLLALSMGRSTSDGIEAIHETVIMLHGLPVKNVWNLVLWDGSASKGAPQSLLGIIGEKFVTVILRIDPTTATASVIGNSTAGPPVRGIATFGGGHYFFLASGVKSRALLKFSPDKLELVEWIDPAFNTLYSISFDHKSGTLIGSFAVGSYALSLRIIDWAEKSITEMADLSDAIPQGHLSPYDVSFSPGARNVFLHTKSGIVFGSRNSSTALNLISLEQRKLTSLTLAGLVGFVVFRDVSPRISSTLPTSLLMANLTTVSASGVNFGYKDYTVNASITTRSAIAPVQVQWLSDSSIVLKTPSSPDLVPGPARLNVKFLHGSASAESTYSQSWGTLRPSRAPSSGGVSVTFGGAGFDAGDRYLCNWTSALGISAQTTGVSPSDRTIVCKSPPWLYRGFCEFNTCRTLLLPQLIRAAANAQLLVPPPEGAIPVLQIEPGIPSELAILRGQTKDIRASALMHDPFVVAVQDAKGNNCEQGSEYQILIALSSCPSNSSENLMQAHTSGSVLIASTLTLPRSASGCRLKFFSAGLGLAVYSDVLSVIEGVPARLTVQDWSMPVYGGSSFQVNVVVTDRDGNVVRDAINVSAELQASTDVFIKPLKGTLLVQSNNGSAVFTDLIVDKAGYNYLLTFVSKLPELTETIVFDILVGAAAEVRVNWTDKDVFTSMVSITPPPIVWSVDAGGNPTNTSNLWFHVDLQLESSWQRPSNRNVSAKGNLWGQTTVQAMGGSVTFTNLAVSLKGSGYFLVFSSLGLKKGASALFTVLAGNASWIHILNQPSSGISAVILQSQPLLLVRDDGNNTVDTNVRVNTSLADHPFMHIRGHSSVAAASGVVRFTGKSTELNTILYSCGSCVSTRFPPCILTFPSPAPHNPPPSFPVPPGTLLPSSPLGSIHKVACCKCAVFFSERFCFSLVG